MVYLVNAISLQMFQKDSSVNIKIVGTDKVKEILSTEEWVSGIGHQSTSQVVSTILGLPVEMNRANIALKEGDRLVAFQLQGRLPEGAVLSETEIMSLPYKWYLVEVIG